MSYNDYIFNIHHLLTSFQNNTNILLDIIFQCMIYDGILSSVVLHDDLDIYNKEKIQKNKVYRQNIMS